MASLVDAITAGRRVGLVVRPVTVVSLPNAVTVAGLVAGVAWSAGGPAWLGLAGLLADEVDGRLARALGQTSEFGSSLDWAVDLTLTGLAAARGGLLWLLPAVTVVQAWLRSRSARPTVGSARAVITIYAVATGAR